MSRVFRYFLFVLLFITHLWSSQSNTDEIGRLSSISLYNLDKYSLEQTLKAYVKNHDNIHAIKVIEHITQKSFLTMYKEGSSYKFDTKLPSLSASLQKYKATAYFNEEEVGEIIVYFEKEKALSQDEIAWIKNNGTIRIATLANFKPFDINTNNSHKGFHVDLIKEVNKNLSIRSILVPYKSWKEAYSSVLNGETHAIAALSWNKEREAHFLYSSPYYFSPYQIIVKADNSTISSLEDLASKQLSVREKSIAETIVKEKVPNAKLIYFDSRSKSYKKIQEGIHDATLAANADPKVLKKYGLKIAFEIYHKGGELYIGTNKNHPKVASILNKGVNSISLEKMAELKNRWLVKDKAKKALSIAFGFGRAPFMFDKTSRKGIELDIVKKVLEYQGYSIKSMQQMAMSKQQEAIFDKNSTFDMAVLVPQIKKEGIFYSDEFLAFNNGVFTRKNDNLSIKTPKDLLKLKTVAWDNAYRVLTKEYFELFNPDVAPEGYLEVANQLEQHELFFAKEVDALVVDKSIFNYYKNRLKFKYNTLNEPYEFHQIFDPFTGYKVAFRNKQLSEDFNQGLAKIKKSGEYDKIVQSYFEVDIESQLQFTQVIASVVSKYVSDYNKKGLENVLKPFLAMPFVEGIKIVDTDTQNRFYEFYKSKIENHPSVLTITKDAFYDQNRTIEAVVTLYFNDKVKQIQVESPQFSRFNHLYNKEQVRIRKIYEQNLLLDIKRDDNAIVLTTKEKLFLAKNPVIRVHNETLWAPYNFYEKGRARGLSIDYIKTLANKVGLKVEFVTGPTWAEFLEQAKAKKLDVMLNIVKTPERETFLNFTEPYAELYQSLFVKKGSKPITKTEQLFGKTFVVPEGFYYDDKLQEFPQIKILRVKDTLECIQAISSGKADAMLDLTSVVNYYKRKYKINDVVAGGTLGWEGGSLPLSIGIRKDWPELTIIFNKALNSLSDEEIDEIEYKWLFTNEMRNETKVTLTKEEREWLASNTVKVGVEEWAPIIFSHAGNDMDGITGDILKLVIKRTGLQIEIVNDLWDPLLSKFKNKELDLLPATYYTDERAEYGLFSRPYYKMVDYIYVQERNQNIKSMEDLKGKKLAIPKGYGTISKIEEKFPSITIVQTVDLDDSIQKVLTGEVDALFDGQVAVEHNIQDNLIRGLKGIPQKSFKAAGLHFFSHIDKPILKNILEKALDSIQVQEIRKIKSKWLLETRSKSSDFMISKEQKDLTLNDMLPIKEIIIGAVVFLLIFFLIWKYQIKSSNRDFALKSTLFIIIGLFLFFASAITLVTLQNIEKSQKREIEDSIKTVVNGTYRTIKLWVDAKFRRVEIVLNNGKLRQKLLKLKEDENTHESLVEYFKTYEMVFEDASYALVSPDFEVMLTNNEGYEVSPFGKEAIFTLKEKNSLNKIVVFPEKDDKNIQSNILFIKVIKDKQKDHLAYLIMKVNPDKEFSRILNNGRIGKSGETYAFNEKLQFISNSRFDDELKSLGLLQEGEKSILNIQAKTSNNQPTFLASKALDKVSGLNSKGYLDYRDKPVYGAWIWDNELKIAFATEIDESEAMGAFLNMKKTIIFIVFSIVLFTIFLAALIAWISTQSKKALQKTNAELNRLLDSFDENVIASKTDLKGNITYASKALCEISEYTHDELVGSPQSILRHEDTSDTLFKELWQTIQSGKIWRGELKNKKKSGDFYWVDLIVTPEFDEEGNATGYSAVRQDITSKKEVEDLSKNLEVKVEERTYELQESQQRFLTLFDSAPDGISIIKDGKYIDCNQKTLELFGIESVEEFVKYKPSDFSPEFQENGERSDELEVKRIQDVLQGNNTHFEWVHKRVDTNETFDAEVILAPILINDEQYLYGVVRDISERKAMEREILENQEKIAQNKLFVDTLLDSQEQIVITTDGQRLQSCNKAFLELFNLENMEEFTKDYDCICDRFELDTTGTYLQKYMGELTWIEYILEHEDQTHKAVIKKDYQERIYTVTAAVLPIGNGEMKSAVFTDITALEFQKKQTESILSSVLLPMLITSKESRRILYANSFAAEQYETTMDELIGLDIEELYTYEEQRDDILMEMATQGVVQNFETKFRTLKDNEFDAILSIIDITYEGEECYLGVASDISLQKENEQKMIDINKKVSDSIEYASLIQHALIPQSSEMQRYFDDYFTIWQPKDIVGGDIYLFEGLRNENECLLMVIDCTGHGVPGAFVTMLVKAIERQVVADIMASNDEVSPAKILQYFNATMKKLLRQESDEAISNAGFDGGVLYYNRQENYVKYAGAETPLFYIQDDEVKVVKSNRHSIGYKKSDVNYEFNDVRIEIDKATKLYISTDGYFDQNGGEKGFPFGKKRFSNFIAAHHDTTFSYQKELLLQTMQEYQGSEERNDDTTIVAMSLTPKKRKKVVVNDWNI